MKFLTIFLILFSSQTFAKNTPIDENYFLEFVLDSKDCKKITGKSCYFRDHAIDQKPYFHKTTIVIFKSKAILTQYYNNSKKIFKIKDFHHKLRTIHNNLVTFDVKNGEIFNLELIKGDLSEEQIENSACKKAQIFYDFYKNYNRENELLIKYGSFEDEYNFNSMSQYMIFAPKNDRNNIMTMASKGGEDFMPAKSLNLCHFEKTQKAIQKHVNRQDCKTQASDECLKYEECKPFLLVEDCKTLLFRGF